MVLALKDLKTYLLKQKSLVCYSACNPRNFIKRILSTLNSDTLLNTAGWKHMLDFLLQVKAAMLA